MKTQKIPAKWRFIMWSLLRSKEFKLMTKFLEGKKEIIVTVLGAIALLLPVFGLSPEYMTTLTAIQNAIAGGDWHAALAAVLSAVALLARAAFRARLNRVDATKVQL